MDRAGAKEYNGVDDGYIHSEEKHSSDEEGKDVGAIANQTKSPVRCCCWTLLIPISSSSTLTAQLKASVRD